MKKGLLLLLVFNIFCEDCFSSHAAGMDLTYECLTTDTVWMGNYQVNIATAAWGNECSWNITDNNTGAVIESGSGYNNNSTYTINVCIPSGNYTFNWFDSFGDGWNGGSYTVTTNTGAVLTSGSPPTGSSGSSAFTSSGSTCSYTLINYPANTYKITLNFYRDCSNGISAPSTFSLDYSSNSCSYSNSFTMNQVSFQNITPACNSIPNPCNTPGIIGIEEYVYQTIITLPNNCSDWILSVCEAARNGAITTINNPGAQDLCVEAELNNTNNYQNSSPIFTEYPTPYICVNQSFCYNNGAIDPDGDSLVYSLVTPLNSAAGGTVTYIAPFSAFNPISGTTTFDSLTGDLCMLATQVQVSVVAMKVSEYRNGVFIGSVIRDIQIIVLDNCSSIPPVLSGIDTIAPVNSDSSGGIATRDFCTDGSTPVIFNINTVTSSSSNNITMSWDNSISNASFNISANNTSSPQAVFSWVPTITDVPNSPFYFTVTVVDDACPINNSFSYTYTVLLSYSSGSFISTDVSCFGLQDGAVDLSVAGGVPPYNYFWWDSVSGFNTNTQDLTNLNSGNYYCFIVDSLLDTLGCGVEPILAVITEPQELIVNSIFSNVSCFGLNDGSIDLTVSGGIPPYSVSWTSNGGYLGSGTNISNLSSDVYTATITDANNCGPIFESVFITEPSEITLFGTSSDVSCFGFNDGNIDLVTTGTNLNYSWIGPNGFISNLEDINSLEPGVYTISITDVNGCFGPSDSYIIVEPADILVSYVITDVSCNGLNDGSINLTISGGVGNYTTLWNSLNGYFNISEDAFSLYSGPYNYTISDINGCSPSSSNSPLLVNQPLSIQVTSVVTDETCYEDSDGTIDVTITGPGTFTYSWVGPNSFSSSSLDIFSLQAGNYNLIITDINNCQTLVTESVNIGNVITIDTFVNNVSCNGLMDGNIVLLAPNSINPTFSWSGPNSFTSSSSQVLNLPAGVYSVVVNDNSNCPTQLTLPIIEPSPLSINSMISNESCEGVLDGSIEVFISGGTPNYTYVWNNGNGDSINSNLLNGDYILNIFDANNCIITDSFTVSLFLFDTIRSIINVSCYGGSDGSVDLDIIGGYPPFTYSWNTGVTSQDLNNIPSAVYTVDITDITNCTISRDVIITSPQQLAAVTNVTLVLCYGDTTATVSTQINGGVSPYLLDWGNTDTTAMEAGFHIFTVTDNNNCKFTDSVEVFQNDSMQISSVISDVQCFGGLTGEIEIQISQGTGTPPYSYSWTGPNNFSSVLEDLIDLESGDYFLTIIDANLCIQELQLFVNQPQQLSQITTINTSDYSGYNVRCIGGNSAWVQLSVSGGYAPYTFLWDNGNQTDSIYNLYEGPYSVLITDSLGCTENININLNEPTTYVTANVISNSDFNGYNISCFNLNDGSVYVDANNGVFPYTYLWNTEETTKSISNLYSGYYEVFVYDNNMCLAIDSITLTEPTELLFDLFYYQDTCSREVGKADFLAEGGVANYTALWSNSSTEIVVDNLSEGDYSVDITDANSCMKTESFVIKNLESPIVDFKSYPYHKRLFDQQNEPFYFVDLTNTFWSSVKNWNWSFGDGYYAYDSVVSHIYEENGEYLVHLEIITHANCIDTISKKVVVDEYSFYIPNSFIPTSNEVQNSIFKGYGVGIENYELKIFSRWGELIFETQNLEEGWNGNYYASENPCPVAVYTYSVFIENIYGEIFEYQGQVKLLR